MPIHECTLKEMTAAQAIVTPIYHITHFANLDSIIRRGGLACDADAERQHLCQQSIAYDDLKARRRRRLVEKLDGGAVAAGGMLPDYVPFYFCNRSPMLGAIHKGQVPGYQGGQHDVIYLVSHAEAVAKSDLVWCFTDGHAVEAVTQFFDELEDLQRIDWTAVRTWRWGGRWLLGNPDVKRRKQAEFLVHGTFPWNLVDQIGVLDENMAVGVKGSLRDARHKPKVTIQPDWYYNR